MFAAASLFSILFSVMIRDVLVVGPFQSNCYLLGDPAAGEGAIIDPGDEPEEILRAAGGLEVRWILLTHGHLDHVSGVRRVKEVTGAKVLIHPADRGLYEGLRNQYASARRTFGIFLGEGHDPPAPDGFLEEGGEVSFGRFRLRVIHTPGHTPGSCCFQGEGGVFTGDTLFQGGIGRTDLPGGSLEDELRSIRTKLYVLDPRTAVWPGHGPATRVGEEREGNPFTQD